VSHGIGFVGGTPAAKRPWRLIEYPPRVVALLLQSNLFVHRNMTVYRH